jgi:predicted transposase/invertase (TIGR01784 family)
MERLQPLNDYLFMKLFGEKGDEEQLLSFLNAVLNRKNEKALVSIEILENKTFTPEIIGDKTSILDSRAITSEGEHVNIEVQLKDLHNMARRSLFYWSQNFNRSIIAGQEYNELPNVIAINIVNFDYIPLDDFHTVFHMREDKHTDYILTEAIEIHFINMIKYRKVKNKDFKNNLLERWLAFLDEKTPEDTLQEVMKMDATIQHTAEKMEFLSSDKEVLRLYQLRNMGLSDITSAVNTGIKQNTLEIAKNALRAGATIDFVKTITGLDTETIKKVM